MNIGDALRQRECKNVHMLASALHREYRGRLEAATGQRMEPWQRPTTPVLLAILDEDPTIVDRVRDFRGLTVPQREAWATVNAIEIRAGLKPTRPRSRI